MGSYSKDKLTPPPHIPSPPEKKRANCQKLLKQRRETSSCLFAPSCVPKQIVFSTNNWMVFN